MSKLKYIIEHLYEITDGRYEVVGAYKSYDAPLLVKCNIHDETFSIAQASTLLKFPTTTVDKPIYLAGCSKCIFESKHVVVNCAYCGRSLVRPRSWLNSTKSGLAFCSVDHKHKAQSKSFGLTEIQPEHYNSNSDYRKIAFESYEHECSICGWDDDPRILEVHHIDGDRTNNCLSNLTILCPNCHKKISLGLYVFENNKLIPVSEEQRHDYYSKCYMNRSKQTGKPVLCIEDGNVFRSIKDCARYYNVSDAAVFNALKSETNELLKLHKHFTMLEFN